MTTVRLNETAYTFPDTWEEIPAGIRANVLRVVWEFSNGSGPVSRPKSRLAVLYYMNPIPSKVFKKLVPWQIHELCSLLDWVFEKPIESRPFDSFEHGGVTYFTPGESFKATTFAEFLNAYAYFFQLMYDEDADREETSAKLVATLCRPAPPDLDVLSPSWSGDFREPFNEHVVEPRSELLTDINPGVLAGIIQYFLHELRWLYTNYEIFETASREVPEPDPDEVQPADDESEPETYDWIATLMDMKDIKYILVEEKLYLTPQAVMNDSLNNVFDALIRLKERESKYEPAPQSQVTTEEYEH